MPPSIAASQAPAANDAAQGPDAPPEACLDRRHFNTLGLSSLASLSAWLAGCGGGSSRVDDPGQPVAPAPGPGSGGEAAQTLALPLVGVGMQGLMPWTVAGPTSQLLTLKSLDRLADGRIAVSWVDAPPPGHLGPWRLHLRLQSCQGACGGGERILSEGLADGAAAVTVLPDGSALAVWREVQERLPGQEAYASHRLLMQRYTPAGQAAGEPELVDGFRFSATLEGGGRRMGPPAIGQWGDGSFVITWADVRAFGAFPGIAAQVRSRRYAANGWAPEAARTVATSYREAGFTLQMPPASGGYVISHVQRPVAPFYQDILPLEFWNPLPAEPLQGLLPGSFLLSLGVCGTLLFAGRQDPVTGQPVFTRERFEYSGHVVDSPARLASLPVGAIALKEVEFLSLSKSASEGRVQAQRMDKHGRILGMPFEMPQGPTVLLPDGSLLVGFVAPASPGSQLLLQRFVPLPLGPAPGLTAL